MSEQSDEQLSAEIRTETGDTTFGPEDVWAGRHMSVQHFQSLFDHDHLPEALRQVAAPFADLAVLTVASVGDGPELSACLRKLLEAKDCAVRQAVKDHGGRF